MTTSAKRQRKVYELRLLGQHGTYSADWRCTEVHLAIALNHSQ